MSVGVIRGGATLPLNELFIRYMNVMGRRGPADWDRNIGGEVESLLRRLDWLLYQIRLADLEFQYKNTPGHRQVELMLALPTLTEAWYYIAFRTMRFISRKCPELEAFEVLPITYTRNNLIEHPDRKGASDVYTASFATGNVGGPEVKGARWDGQSDSWQDEGVYTSAKMFEANLTTLLQPFLIEDLQWLDAQNHDSE